MRQDRIRCPCHATGGRECRHGLALLDMRKSAVMRCSIIVALLALLLADCARAQDMPLELTPADPEGKIAVESKYGSIEAVGRESFRVSEGRRRSETVRAQEFSRVWTEVDSTGICRRISVGVIDLSRLGIEPADVSRESNREKR